MEISLQSCSVCHEEVERHCASICNGCGQIFHLNQRSDIPGKDCGDVWLDDEHLGLEFACNTCLTPAEVPADLDEIIDLTEASEAIGLSEQAVREAADGGAIRHRKTSSGTYLFVRRDVVAYQR